MADASRGTAEIDFAALVSALQGALSPQKRFEAFAGALGRKPIRHEVD